MAKYRFKPTQKSLFYTAKTLLGAAICWYALVFFGIPNPIWAVISVIIVSDADLSTTATLSKVRVINTIVGCISGIISLSLFGYTPLICLMTAAFTVLIVTSIEHYPLNWRLAPVTVVIVMDASRQAAGQPALGKNTEILYALTRASEIGVGCFVALILAYLFSQLATKTHFLRTQNQDETE